MKPLYITAVVTFSGKTALALGIGLKLQAAGKRVGYFKPVSTQPFISGGKVIDEDADFVKRSLGLNIPTEELSPVVIDESLFDKILHGKTNRNFLDDVKTAYQKASDGKDVLIIEGGSSLREGYGVEVSPVRLIDELDLPTLGVVRYRSGIFLVDDVLALRDRVGAAGKDMLVGAVINSVPAEAMDHVKGKIVPFLERQNVRILGVLPQQHTLMSMTVDEMTAIAGGKTLVKGRGDAIIENITVGAMSVETAMGYFRRILRKLVITGGDRADIQAAALETSTTALLLTGNLNPTSTVLKHAEERGVAVVLVPDNTIDAVERVEKFFGKTRLAHPEKLNRFRETLDAHFDWARFMSVFG